MRNLLLSSAITACVSSCALADEYATLTLVHIDNGYRVPAGDPNFDPDAWETVLMFLQGGEPGQRLRQIDLDFQADFFQHPTHDSMFPQDDSIIAAVPSARFDSWVDIPGVEHKDIFTLALNWTSTDFVGPWIGGVPYADAPSFDDRMLVAQFTVAPGTLDRYEIPLGGEVTIIRPNNTLATVLMDSPLTPNPGRSAIDETGDDSDGQMTMDIEWLWEGGHIGDEEYDGRLRFFIPADRVQSIDSVTGPWSARKIRLNGVFGVFVESTFITDDDDHIGEFSLAFTSGVSERTLRITTGFERSRFEPYGYWAPTAEGPLAGDTNDDGIVDFADLNNILTDFGAPGEGTEWLTDLDGSGTVDFGDLNAVLSNFGQQG